MIALNLNFKHFNDEINYLTFLFFSLLISLAPVSPPIFTILYHFSRPSFAILHHPSPSCSTARLQRTIRTLAGQRPESRHLHVLYDVHESAAQCDRGFRRKAPGMLGLRLAAAVTASSRLPDSSEMLSTAR